MCEYTEKNRYDQETILDLEQKIHTYEAQIQTLKSEKSKLNAEYQLAKSNLDKNENEIYEKEAETKVILGSLTQEVDKLTREKKHLHIQIDVEKSKHENEVKKYQTLLDEFSHEKESQQKRLEKQKDSFELKTSKDEEIKSSGNKIIDIASKHDNLEHMNSQHAAGNINILEGLQSKLKQKDGEILQLQKEINKLENVRESMAKEMVNLSNKLENIKEQLKEYPEMQKNYQVSFIVFK